MTSLALSAPLALNTERAREAQFAAACLDGAHPVPDGLAAPATDRREHRFAVYRNNVVVSLIDALAAKYPAVAAIVGDDFFRATARLYAAAHPPRSPVMAQFGDAFAAFLASFAPASGLPYLADVARLEALVLRAYHAADAATLDARHLPALAAGTVELRRHPAAFALRADWPALTLWRMNTGREPLGEVTCWTAQDVLVTRPRFDVLACLLPPGGAAFLAALDAGPASAAAAAIEVPGAQLPPIIETLVRAGAFSAPEIEP